MQRVSKRRSDQLRRTYVLIALLRQHGGQSIDALARELAVTTRTIRRDLEALEAAGLPLMRVTEDGGTEMGAPWRFLKGAPCPICNRGLATGKEYREQRATSCT